jgi:hypothetical protein
VVECDFVPFRSNWQIGLAAPRSRVPEVLPGRQADGKFNFPSGVFLPHPRIFWYKRRHEQAERIAASIAGAKKKRRELPGAFVKFEFPIFGLD